MDRGGDYIYTEILDERLSRIKGIERIVDTDKLWVYRVAGNSHEDWTPKTTERAFLRGPSVWLDYRSNPEKVFKDGLEQFFERYLKTQRHREIYFCRTQAQNLLDLNFNFVPSKKDISRHRSAIHAELVYGSYKAQKIKKLKPILVELFQNDCYLVNP